MRVLAFFNVSNATDYMPFGMVAASNILTTNNFGFNGRLKNDEIYGADGFIDYGERGYDPRRAQWLSVDGAADEYPDLTPYAFTDNNPIHNHEVDGNYIESAWDAISLGMGIVSFVDNVNKGNYLDATIDAVGIIADGAALITPIVPGGAGAGIKALRGGVKVVDKVNDARKAATTTKKAAVVTKTATTTVVKNTVKTAEKKVVAKVVTKTPAKKVVANTKGVVPTKKPVPVQKYEVGNYNDLKKTSVSGDKLDIHHFPQKQPAKNAIPGYDPKTGNSIALPEDIHKKIPTQKGEYKGTARDLLAKDAKDLKKVGVPNEVIQKGIKSAKEQYPNSYVKPK